jgi:hypothetical protein
MWRVSVREIVRAKQQVCFGGGGSPAEGLLLFIPRRRLVLCMGHGRSGSVAEFFGSQEEGGAGAVPTVAARPLALRSGRSRTPRMALPRLRDWSTLGVLIALYEPLDFEDASDAPLRFAFV